VTQQLKQPLKQPLKQQVWLALLRQSPQVRQMLGSMGPQQVGIFF
jgi:hypothetical protein